MSICVSVHTPEPFGVCAAGLVLAKAGAADRCGTAVDRCGTAAAEMDCALQRWPSHSSSSCHATAFAGCSCRAVYKLPVGVLLTLTCSVPEPHQLTVQKQRDSCQLLAVRVSL